jgi:hypothetical protein
MDDRVEAFLRDVLALEGENSMLTGSTRWCLKIDSASFTMKSRPSTSGVLAEL